MKKKLIILGLAVILFGSGLILFLILKPNSKADTNYIPKEQIITFSNDSSKFVLNNIAFDGGKMVTAEGLKGVQEGVPAGSGAIGTISTEPSLSSSSTETRWTNIEFTEPINSGDIPQGTNIVIGLCPVPQSSGCIFKTLTNNPSSVPQDMTSPFVSQNAKLIVTLSGIAMPDPDLQHYNYISPKAPLSIKVTYEEAGTSAYVPPTLPPSPDPASIFPPITFPDGTENVRPPVADADPGSICGNNKDQNFQPAVTNLVTASKVEKKPSFEIAKNQALQNIQNHMVSGWTIPISDIGLIDRFNQNKLTTSDMQKIISFNLEPDLKPLTDYFQALANEQKNKILGNIKLFNYSKKEASKGLASPNPVLTEVVNQSFKIDPKLKYGVIPQGMSLHGNFTLNGNLNFNITGSYSSCNQYGLLNGFQNGNLMLNGTITLNDSNNKPKATINFSKDLNNKAGSLSAVVSF